MNLKERIERWRSDEGIDRSIPAIDPYDAGKLNARLQCAAELEADLRELMELLDKLIEAGKAMTCDGSEAYIRSTRKEWNEAHCALVRKLGPLRS